MRLETLQQIKNDAANCTACDLHLGRTNSVVSRGSVNAKIILLGEGPGFYEDQQGLPFVGPSGKLLDNMIRAMGMEPADVYICNAVNCRPPNNRKPYPEEIKTCNDFLKRQITLIDPRVILTLGATAAESLLGFGDSVGKRRGRWHEWNKIPLRVTYHPSALLRDSSKKQEAWLDLQAVLKFLKE